MKVFKALVKKIRLGYHSWMIDLAFDGFEGAKMAGNTSDMAYWDKLYAKHLDKFKKIDQ